MTELPKGWVEATIRDLCELINGKAFKPSDWTTEGLPIVRIQNLNNPNSNFNHYQGLVEEKFLIEDGQLLFAWSGTPGTSFGAHVWNGGRAVLNQHIFKVNFPVDLINKHFLRNAINQKLEELIGKAHGGAGLQHVTKGKFEDTLIYLPPLAEQERIVAKLEALNAKSARTRTELARIETLVSRFKQAVLSKAFSGELTREWRTQRGSLPSWQYLPLSKLIADGPTNGWSPKADGKVGGLKSLKLSATSSGALRLNENTIKYLDQTLPGNSKFWLLVNDILIQRANSLELLGTTVLFDGPPSEFIYPDLMMRVRADERKALPKYLATFLNSDGARTHFRANATGTAGNMPKINGTTVRETRVPAPPLEEQHEIVRRIESAFAKIDRLATEAKRALELVGRLDEAILAKAFRGELVPQDENDEPAEHLLARIRAEREAAPKGRRGRSTKG